MKLAKKCGRLASKIKTKLRDIPEVTSFVTNLSLRGQLHWAWPKREIESLILWQKASEFNFLGLKTFLDVTEITKPKKTILAVWTLKRNLQIHPPLQFVCPSLVLVMTSLAPFAIDLELNSIWFDSQRFRKTEESLEIKHHPVT